MDIPDQLNGIFYSDFLTRLVTMREDQVYLEIGVQAGLNLSKIFVEEAIGIDPEFHLQHDVTAGKQLCSLHRCSSDRFFRRGRHLDHLRGRVDFAFLDGMHLFEFLLRDIHNVEKLASKSAVLALHDCLPLDGEMIERINNYEGRSEGPYRAAWTGDVWKVIPILEKYRPDLQILLVDCAPTGIVLVSNLDSSNNDLEDRYHDIVRDFAAQRNDRDALMQFYGDRTLLQASSLLSDHTLFLKT